MTGPCTVCGSPTHGLQCEECRQGGTYLRKTGNLFTFPLPPNMGNARRHWRVTLKQKKAYWKACDNRQTTGAIPGPPATPHTRVRVKATLFVWNIMDEDGAMSRVKWAMDWLTNNRYIADDNRKVVEWTGIPTQVIDRKDQRLQIMVEPIEEREAA